MGIGCEFVPFLDYLGQYVAVLDMHACMHALSLSLFVCELET